jgi:hypothetical protein
MTNAMQCAGSNETLDLRICQAVGQQFATQHDEVRDIGEFGVHGGRIPPREPLQTPFLPPVDCLVSGEASWNLARELWSSSPLVTPRSPGFPG